MTYIDPKLKTAVQPDRAGGAGGAECDCANCPKAKAGLCPVAKLILKEGQQ